MGRNSLFLQHLPHFMSSSSSAMVGLWNDTSRECDIIADEYSICS